jgi:hypothetical protein
MTILRNIREDRKNLPVIEEGNADRSWGLQEGRGLCKKITERAKTSNTGGYDMGLIKDAVAGVLDGLNMHLLQIAGKEKSPVLNKISMLLDDAFTEISKAR